MSFQKAGRLKAERYAAIVESTKRLAGCQRNFRLGGVPQSCGNLPPMLEYVIASPQSQLVLASKPETPEFL